MPLGGGAPEDEKETEGEREGGGAPDREGEGEGGGPDCEGETEGDGLGGAPEREVEVEGLGGAPEREVEGEGLGGAGVVEAEEPGAIDEESDEDSDDRGLCDADCEAPPLGIDGDGEDEAARGGQAGLPCKHAHLQTRASETPRTRCDGARRSRRRGKRTRAWRVGNCTHMRT